MDTVTRKTEWSTAYDGTEFRIVVVDECSGSKFADCHHMQIKGENTAKCMNGSKVVYVAPDDGIVVCTDCGTRFHNVADSINCDHTGHPADCDSETHRTIEDDTREAERNIPPAVFSDLQTLYTSPYRGAAQYQTPDADDFDRNTNL